MAAAHCTKTEAAHIQCYFDRTLQPQFFFFKLKSIQSTQHNEVSFPVPGSTPADLPRHHVLFLHYFCPGWLSNRIMNNILAVVLMDPSDIIMLPSERFIKGPANHFCSPDGDS